MKKIKLTNDNKLEKLTDWKESDVNRSDELFYITSDINTSELQSIAFGLGLLINVEAQGYISKVTFIDILN